MNKKSDSAGTPGEIVRAKRKEKGLSQTGLAKKVGSKQQTIGKIELGIIKESRLFRKISVELGIPMSTLIPPEPGSVEIPTVQAQIVPAEQVRTGQRDLPVHVAAEGGPGEMIVSTEPIDWVLRPSPLANVSRAYGIIIVGYSMVPELEPGDTALINPHLPPERDATFVFYAEADGEARATVKRLLRFNGHSWFVKQWNPPKGQKSEFTLSRGEWGNAHRVVGKNSR